MKHPPVVLAPAVKEEMGPKGSIAVGGPGPSASVGPVLGPQLQSARLQARASRAPAGRRLLRGFCGRWCPPTPPQPATAAAAYGSGVGRRGSGSLPLPSGAPSVAVRSGRPAAVRHWGQPLLRPLRALERACSARPGRAALAPLLPAAAAGKGTALGFSQGDRQPSAAGGDVVRNCWPHPLGGRREGTAGVGPAGGCRGIPPKRLGRGPPQSRFASHACTGRRWPQLFGQARGRGPPSPDSRLRSAAARMRRRPLVQQAQ